MNVHLTRHLAEITSTTKKERGVGGEEGRKGGREERKKERVAEKIRNEV